MKQLKEEVQRQLMRERKGKMDEPAQEKECKREEEAAVRAREEQQQREETDLQQKERQRVRENRKRELLDKLEQHSTQQAMNTAKPASNHPENLCDDGILLAAKQAEHDRRQDEPRSGVLTGADAGSQRSAPLGVAPGQHQGQDTPSVQHDALPQPISSLNESQSDADVKWWSDDLVKEPDGEMGAASDAPLASCEAKAQKMASNEAKETQEMNENRTESLASEAPTKPRSNHLGLVTGQTDTRQHPKEIDRERWEQDVAAAQAAREKKREDREQQDRTQRECAAAQERENVKKQLQDAATREERLLKEKERKMNEREALARQAQEKQMLDLLKKEMAQAELESARQHEQEIAHAQEQLALAARSQSDNDAQQEHAEPAPKREKKAKKPKKTRHSREAEQKDELDIAAAGGDGTVSDDEGCDSKVSDWLKASSTGGAEVPSVSGHQSDQPPCEAGQSAHESKSQEGDRKRREDGGGNEATQVDKGRDGLKDKEGDRKLSIWQMARHGKVQQLEALMLQEGDAFDPDVRDPKGNTLLHHACMHGKKRVAKAVLRRGADLNAQNKQGDCLPERWGVASAALTNQRAHSLPGNTCLHYCFAYGYSELGMIEISLALPPFPLA